jgi:hypothetical protein
MRGFRFLEMRGGCGCARPPPPRSITRPLAREEERLAHIAEPAAGRSEAEEKKEKNGTGGVLGGGYFAPHDTNNNFWIFAFEMAFGL